MMGCGAAKAVQTEDTSSANGKVVTDKIKPITNGTNGTAARRLSKAETRPMTPGLHYLSIILVIAAQLNYQIFANKKSK